METAYNKASRGKSKQSTMKFSSLRAFEMAFLNFAGLLGQQPNDIDFAKIETALKTILSNDDAESLVKVMQTKPELALAALSSLTRKLEGVITSWHSAHSKSATRELQQEFFTIHKNFNNSLYQNFDDQPALTYLGLFHMKDKSGVWQYKNDSYVCVLCRLFIEKVLNSYITPKLAIVDRQDAVKRATDTAPVI